MQLQVPQSRITEWPLLCTYPTAVQQYKQQGSSITDPHPVGEDPLALQRQQEWTIRCGMSPEQVFTQLMSGNTQALEDAFITFIDITNELKV